MQLREVHFNKIKNTSSLCDLLSRRVFCMDRYKTREIHIFTISLNFLYDIYAVLQKTYITFFDMPFETCQKNKEGRAFDKTQGKMHYNQNVREALKRKHIILLSFVTQTFSLDGIYKATKYTIYIYIYI